MYTLKSEIDKQSFEVDQKVVDASTLLKNICDLTDVSESIIINCSGACIKYYIDFISNYDLYNDRHNFEEIEILQKFNDAKIYEIVKEMAIWDSDIYFDFIADLILYRIFENDDEEESKETCMESIQKFFDFVDDFSVPERNYIKNHKSDFLFSINTAEMKFPFSNRNFQSLQNKLYTPMNVLLARIIKRSGAYEAFQFSMINKALKNENDRHPIKISTLSGAFQWDFEIRDEYGDDKVSFSLMYTTNYDRKYWDAIKNRKLQIYEQFFLEFGSKFYLIDDNSKYSIFDYIIPYYGLEVNFYREHQHAIYGFDVSKCSYPVISYKTHKININFKNFYQRFVEKDLSKLIWIEDYSSFKFFKGGHSNAHMSKKKNASKFHEIVVYPDNDDTNVLPEFKDFVLNYMEDDGIIKISKNIFEVPNTYDEKWKLFVYDVSSVKKML